MDCKILFYHPLQEQAEQIKTQIANMKQYLSNIVQGYGYKNVKEFMAEFKASKAEYTDISQRLQSGNSRPEIRQNRTA